MPKATSYLDVKLFIESKNQRLITSEEEFYYLKIKNKSTPNSTKISIECANCEEKFDTTFYQYKDRNKRKCNKCSRKKEAKWYSQELIDEVLRMYNEGITTTEIRKKLKIRTGNVSRILKDNGIKIKGNLDYRTSAELATTKKYSFNEDYFENIDDPKKAYWLGFLYADGNVYIPNGNDGGSKGGRIELGLKREDEYHLYNFIQDIKGNYKVSRRNVKLNGNIYEASRVQIGSIKMARDLTKHGCVQNKSLILKYPTTVPKHLMCHFIRGYIDGDGSIGFYVYEKTSSFFVDVLGTYEFLDGLKKNLSDEGINSGYIHKQNSKAFKLGICGRDNLVNLFDYLYGNATVFLERKFKKYVQALKYYDKYELINQDSKNMCENFNRRTELGISAEMPFLLL